MILVGLFWFHIMFKQERELSLPANIYLFKVNNRNTRKRREICSKLIIKTPERRHWLSSGVFIVNFEHTLHLVLVFLLLTFYWKCNCRLGIVPTFVINENLLKVNNAGNISYRLKNENKGLFKPPYMKSKNKF